jgi:hypothetical protein
MLSTIIPSSSLPDRSESPISPVRSRSHLLSLTNRRTWTIRGSRPELRTLPHVPLPGVPLLYPPYIHVLLLSYLSSSLPSEALEEFLSILRPAIFPPSSPVLRPRRNGALSLPAFSVTYKSKIDSFTKSDLNLPDELDSQRQTPTCSPEPIADHLPGNWDIFSPEITSRWHAQVLGVYPLFYLSPVPTHRHVPVQPLPSPACTLAIPFPVMPLMISRFPPFTVPLQ